METPSIVLCVATFHACHLMAPVDWIRPKVTCIGRHDYPTSYTQVAYTSSFKNITYNLCISYVYIPSHHLGTAVLV